MLISIKDSLAGSLAYGDELLVPAKYRSVDPPFNPAEFNYKKYLAGKNIFYQEIFVPPSSNVVLAQTRAIHWSRILLPEAAVCRKAKTQHARYRCGCRSLNVILGYKAGLSSDVMRVYSDTGTVYVLTVSGAQVGIIYLIINYFTWLFRTV